MNMTQEEKARKYDEALERAKEIYHRGYYVSGDIEHIFPELKESEDERIRKALIEMVHDTTGDELWVDYNVHKEEALAWLEKQGETFTKRDVDDAYLKGISDARNELEKQGEQNSVDKLELIKLKEPDVYEYELERIVDKLNEVIGKLGDIYQVLSNPFQFPYRDYTPPSPVPGMDVWYKTHGVERVTPVTCETTNVFNKSEDNESKRVDDR